MPTLPGGKVDPVKAAAWVRANIDLRQRESGSATEAIETKTPKRGTLAEEKTRVGIGFLDGVEFAVLEILEPST